MPKIGIAIRLIDQIGWKDNYERQLSDGDMILAHSKGLVWAMLNAFLALNTLAAPLEAIAAQRVWVLKKDAAECILKNLDKYQALNSKVVIISVENCPNTDLFASAMSGKKNAGGLTTDIKTSKKTSDFDRFISYPKTAFKCLNASKVVFEENRVLFPKAIDCAK